MTPWAPERGDVVWITMDGEDDHPRARHEQRGRRPALVLSPVSYNSKVGLAILCPITRHAKGYPFEVALPEGAPVEGVVLADQARSMDWRARGAAAAGVVPSAVTLEVLVKVGRLLAP